MTLNSLDLRSSASVKWSGASDLRTETNGIAQLHRSQFQETTTAKERRGEVGEDEDGGGDMRLAGV